jgi:hypothetical protein
MEKTIKIGTQNNTFTASRDIAIQPTSHFGRKFNIPFLLSTRYIKALARVAGLVKHYCSCRFPWQYLKRYGIDEPL